MALTETTEKVALIQSDAVTFGLIMAVLGLIFIQQVAAMVFGTSFINTYQHYCCVTLFLAH